MKIALILMREVGVMALLIALGIYNKKKGIFTTEMANKLSNFLVSFVMPALLINTLQRERDPATLPAFWTALVFSGIFLALTAFVSALVFRPKDNSEQYKLERLAAVLPNCGFMGIPLLIAACGEGSILYCTAVLGIFQMLTWCWAVPLLEGNRPSIKQIFINPGMLAFAAGLAMFLLEIRLPPVFISFMTQITGLNTPLSLLMIGIFLAGINPREVIFSAPVYKIVFFRNLAVPLAAILAIYALGLTARFGKEFSLSIVILMGCSSAASAMLLPIRAGKDGAYASQMVAASAFLSIITLPFVAFIADMVF